MTSITNRTTHGNQLEEDPFQAGALCLGAEGNQDHQDRGASFREGNQDQEGKADGLGKVV